MKEATGELNLSAVVAISIGVLAAFFFTIIWPMLKGDFSKNNDCNRATCDCSVKTRNAHNKKCLCKTKNSTGTFECVYKG